MGQEVGVTPLQMITAVSVIANGGLLYKPHVVQEMRRGDQILLAGWAFGERGAASCDPAANGSRQCGG